MRYALFFAFSVICLTAGTVVTFDHMSVTTAASLVADTRPQPTADTLPTAAIVTPAVPTAADYARFADADGAWREKYARQYTLSELRARGDGRRTARDSVQDRVFRYAKSDQRQRAIAELERWVAMHPDDADLLLSLARLLSEEGRNDDAIRRYRQILALRQRSE